MPLLLTDTVKVYVDHPLVLLMVFKKTIGRLLNQHFYRLETFRGAKAGKDTKYSRTKE